jgi:hypothetical protein
MTPPNSKSVLSRGVHPDSLIRRVAGRKDALQRNVIQTDIVPVNENYITEKYNLF